MDEKNALEERREVAERLRETMLTEGAAVIEKIDGLGPAAAARFVAIPNLIAALNFDKAIVSMQELTDHLADLIDPPEITEDTSDGYHTFGQLYYQRMVLFAVLVQEHRDRAWKTWNHEDGEPCFGGGWFLVTIDTPRGAYGYHFDAKYWRLFDCAELPKAKHWDGYTEENVNRLFSLNGYEVSDDA